MLLPIENSEDFKIKLTFCKDKNCVSQEDKELMIDFIDKEFKGYFLKIAFQFRDSSDFIAPDFELNTKEGVSDCIKSILGEKITAEEILKWNPGKNIKARLGTILKNKLLSIYRKNTTAKRISENEKLKKQEAILSGIREIIDESELESGLGNTEEYFDDADWNSLDESAGGEYVYSELEQIPNEEQTHFEEWKANELKGINDSFPFLLEDIKDQQTVSEYPTIFFGHPINDENNWRKKEQQFETVERIFYWRNLVEV